VYRYIKIIICIIVTCQILSCCAFELDTSVDDEIRRNYNPSALENKLPALPKTSPSAIQQTNSAPPKSLPIQQKTSNVQIGVKSLPNNYSKVDKTTAIRIKKGTKFKVKSNVYLSDTTREGTYLTFTTLQPVTQRYVTIPTGSKLNALVTNSHPPQISGNGGLLEIAVNSINYKGRNFYAHAKITKANHKKVFVNNIKGKRQYWKNVSKQVDKGENFYKKTRRTSSKLADNPVGIIVSPIPTVVGMGAYAVNLVAAPISSIGSKGGRISIPAGSEFEIKLLEDVYLE
jgi:hypothetical protein